MPSLAFSWDSLPLIHFPKQATTGWVEAIVGTKLEVVGGEWILFLLKQLGLGTSEFLRRGKLSESIRNTQ